MIGSIKLDGQWHFYADEEQKYTGFPPEQSRFTDTIRLPGTTAQHRKGSGAAKTEKGCLTERYPYSGNAWFYREVHIPEELRGKKLVLFLERTRVTSLWVNGSYIGTQNSLCTPHSYDLTAFSGAQDLRILLCVNNASYPTRGGHMTSPDTQTNWNGVIGEMALRFFDTNCITRVKAVPDAASRTVTFRMHTEGSINMVKAHGEWVGIDGSICEIAPQILTVKKDPDGSSYVIMRFDRNVSLWDEYTPIIARITLCPFGTQDKTEISFGFSEFRAQGTHFTSHGREVLLRGKHDGMLFPLEGAAPTDAESWLRVMRTAKSYGMNHYRFHTCCPPDAAFTAADLLGIYMEPEIPFWGSLTAPGDEGYDPAEQAYLITEGRRILETFGNHPSFCLFSLGNELWGSADRMGEIIRSYKQQEKRILFTQGCNNFQFWPNILPEDDFFVGVRLSKDRLIRGSYAACDQPYGHVQAQRPSAMHSYDAIIRPDVQSVTGQTDGTQEIGIQYGTGVKKVRLDKAVGELIPDKPVVMHEIGQYVTYPDFDEMGKYTGVLEPRNFGMFRDRLQKAGMLAQAKDFFTCSGKLAIQCYKEELEAAMRSEHVAGFQILDIQDFSGQGTALVGILDAFMDSKGLVTPEEWRGFCSDSVLLGLFPDYCLTDRLTMQVKLRHCAPQDIQAPLHFTVMRGQRMAAQGTLAVSIEGQGLFDLGQITAELPPASAVHRIDVTLELGNAHNCYRLWQYPTVDAPRLESRDGLCITGDLEQAKKVLAEGGRVLFFPGALTNCIKGFYCADFWCYPMFRSISESMGRELPVGTLGLCIDKRHPAVKAFRCERWSTPQWYDILTHADLAILDGTEIMPIVQMIDNFERNHKLGLLFECRVGKGRMLVCTARLTEVMERPEVRVFARSLLDYVNSPAFQPEGNLTADVLERILR